MDRPRTYLEVEATGIANGLDDAGRRKSISFTTARLSFLRNDTQISIRLSLPSCPIPCRSAGILFPVVPAQRVYLLTCDVSGC